MNARIMRMQAEIVGLGVRVYTTLISRHDPIRCVAVFVRKQVPFRHYRFVANVADTALHFSSRLWIGTPDSGSQRSDLSALGHWQRRRIFSASSSSAGL